MKRRADTETSGVALSEQAVSLLRRMPAGVWALYYVGTLPFALGFLYFWADMSRGAFAASRCAGAAFGLSVLFLWMKCWQAVYCAALRARLSGESAPPWTLRRAARLVRRQAAIQPLGLLAIALSLLVVVPFAWVYAYYQNATVYGAETDSPAATLRRRAQAQARLWPMQNHVAIWLLSPWLTLVTLLLTFGCGWALAAVAGAMGHLSQFVWFIVALMLFVLGLWPCSPLGVVVGINAAAVLVMIPLALHRLLGVETVFTTGGWYGAMNTTFLAVVCAVIFLAMDPVMKAAYVLRCFLGDSQHSGADLRAELRSLAPTRTAAMVLVALGLATAAPALGQSAAPAGPAPAPPAIEAPALDASIARVLQRDEFRWRMPRINPEAPAAAGEPTSWWGRLFKDMGERVRGWSDRIDRAFERLADWLDERLFRRRHKAPEPAEGFAWGAGTQVALYALTGFVICVLVVILLRLRRNRAVPAPVAAQPVAPVDLYHEDVRADQLAADEWTRLAADLVQRGEFRLALRALFLSGLAHLAQQQAVRLATCKSNREYIADLRRRAHRRPDVIAAFDQGVREFERVWYGSHPASAETVTAYMATLTQIRTYANAA